LIISRELQSLYNKLGLSDAEVLSSRKMAALMTLIALDPDSKSKISIAYKQQLQLLRNQVDPEPIISIDDIAALVFPADPAKREQQMAEIRSRRLEDFETMVGETKKKQGLLEGVETRKKKMLHDFGVMLEKVSSKAMARFLSRLAYRSLCCSTWF
jgi:hypothetical protein